MYLPIFRVQSCIDDFDEHFFWSRLSSSELVTVLELVIILRGSIRNWCLSDNAAIFRLSVDE